MSVSFPTFFGPKGETRKWPQEDLDILHDVYLYHQRHAKSWTDLQSRVLADPRMASIVRKRYQSSSSRGFDLAKAWQKLLTKNYSDEDFPKVAQSRTLASIPNKCNAEQLRAHSTTQLPGPTTVPEQRAEEEDPVFQDFLRDMYPHAPEEPEAEMQRQLYEQPVSQKLAYPHLSTPFDFADAAEDEVQGFSDDD